MLDKPAAIKKPFMDKAVTDQLVTGLYNYFGVITFLLVAGIFVSVWVFFIQPKFQEINSGEEYIRKTEEYQSQVKYFLKLNAIKASYENINPLDKQKIETFVNIGGDSNNLYSELAYLARANKMLAVKIDPKELDDKFEIVNIAGSNKRNDLMGQTRVWRTTLELGSDKSGNYVTYQNLKNLLSAMEHNLRLMDVQRVAFDPIKNTAIIELLTYTRK